MILACRDRKKRGAGVIVITKISLVILSCVLVLGLASAGLAQAQDVMVNRSINPDSVPAGGGVVTVTIGITGAYGIGSVVEKLPAGFTYVEGSVTPSDITVGSAGQNVTFSLLGESSFSYRVDTSISSGQHPFPSGSQLTYGIDKDTAPVVGESSVTVEQAQESSVTVNRSINPDSVPAGGGVVTVTIRINGTYGIGSVLEKLPSGFTYVSGSVTPSDITPESAGQDLTFSLVGESSFSYRVDTSISSGQHPFPSGSQLTYGIDKDTAPVVGESSVTVEQAQESSVTVNRSINPDSVPAGGGVVTVTIRINGTYGIGSVLEKLPSGFTYVSGSVTPSDITPESAGQDLTFSLVGESSFSYRVNSSSSSGQHRFPSGSQLTYGVDKDTAPVVGESSVTVRTPPTPPTPPTRPPVQVPNRAPVFSGNAVTRSVNENSASGANVGARVTARDPDGDSLTYTLAGTDASSFIVAATGQIRVGDGTNLDYEGEKNTYVVEVTATDPSGASEMITVTINVTNVGEVTLWASATEALTMAPQVGDTITGAVMDPDGGVTGESWQWARTTTPAMMDSWMDIAGETNAAYTVTEGDTGYYLRVMATYTDAVGTDTAMEYSMPTMMVGAEAGDPLFGYDTSGNGRIDKDELAKAVLDYEVNLTLEKHALADLVFSYELGI